MGRERSISSRDVAREAGVSQATVSYILNDVKNVRIKPETRAAVLDAVKRLNYHPDEIARGMKLKKSMSIGVVTDRNVTNFYFMKTLEGIRDGTQQNDYAITLLFNKPGDITDADYIRYYNSNRLGGLIFAFASISDETVDYMTNNGIPFVKVDAVYTPMDIYQVCTDHLSHIPEVLRYFLASGAERIGYAGPNPSRVTDGRLDAFKAAMGKCGLKVEESLISTCDFNDDEIFSVTRRLLESDRRPDALLAGSPRFGMISLKCALSLGLRVPENLKIITLGTSNFFTVAFPSMTAVELPLYDMGHRAAEMLCERMKGCGTQKEVILPSELVIRESC
jgi:DNA-binding LacI/PurR family transcriptional regulator